jgi:phosphate-selective porin
MQKSITIKAVLCCISLFYLHTQGFCQRYLADYDSAVFIRDTVRPFLKRLEHVHFSGYIQPQFQVVQQKGAPSYAGGNFSEFSSNRFMLRRARMKLDFILPDTKSRLPNVLFTFQIDATERGVNVRDMFVRLYEPKGHNLALTAGVFARPFGYELNLSSAYRETPERGRMSQILMPTERDLGAMLTFEPQESESKKAWFKWDAGIFNGQGLSGPADFDSYKDIISRITFKPMSVSKSIAVSGGLSLLYGGWRQATRYRYTMGSQNGAALFMVDSSERNAGTQTPRHYYGADVQWVKKHLHGKTELRAEYWRGTQPGTATATTNPGELPVAPTYIRNFDGAFFYLLQNIVNEKWELMVKYDWYDPNTKVKTGAIGKPATNLSAADIKFSTLGFGLTRYINDNVKVLAYYDWVKNEKTALPDYTNDIKDNVFTCRVQVRF